MIDGLVNYLRTAVFFVDEIIYNLIANVYELIIYLANVNLFDDPVITELMNRVYVLLGIFMLFKVSFSIIQYIVDPNAFSDKSKGFGKLVTNALVTVILLVSIPSIFSFAFELQGIILESNVIGTLILGGTPGEYKNVQDDISSKARDIQFTMYGAFYTLNTGSAEEINSAQFKGNREEYQKTYPSRIPACAPNLEVDGVVNGPTSNVFGSKDMAKSVACLNALDEEMQKEGAVQSNKVTLNDIFKRLEVNSNDGSKTIIDTRNFHAFDSMLWWKKNAGPEYTINYTPIISTIAGGYLLFLLITFCIDIALRAIKLCFLQMIAPLAVVSYIDPKESMSNSKLHNWIKDALKTYASLFLRLAVIFLALRLVQMITSMVMGGINYYGDITEAPGITNMFVYIFLIIGVFMFAKQVPQMIENIFGFKLSGDLRLNPMKAYKESGLGTAVGLGGAAIGGAVLGGIGNTAANMAKNRELRKKLSDEEYKKQKIGLGGMFGSAIGGVGAGMFRSGSKGLKSQNPFTAVAEGVTEGSQRRRARQAGYGIIQNARDSWTDIAGIPGATGTTSEIKGKIKELTQRKENAQRDEATAADLMRHIIAQDTNKSASFMQAFSEDSDGKLRYSGYDEFFRQQMAQYGEQGQAAIEMFNEAMANQDPMLRQREIDALASQFDGLITSTDYNNLASARTAREEADKRGKDLEKEIKTLQETTEYKKGQKSKK